MATVDFSGSSGAPYSPPASTAVDFDDSAPSVILAAPSPLGTPEAVATAPESVWLATPSPLGAPEVVSEAQVVRAAWIASPTPLGAPEAVSGVLNPVFSWLATPSPIGAPAAFAVQIPAARIACPSPLGAPVSLVLNDFTDVVPTDSALYVMRVTGTPELTIPISSWQATLQTDRQQYVQCVVPAAADHLADLSARAGSEEFVIYRVLSYGGASMEVEMARTTLENLSVDRGPYKETATLSGYTDAFTGPSTYPKATLSGIRSISQTATGNVRARADIDWFLRPGNLCDVDGLEITATYINYYVTSSGQEYMDVGTR